MIEIQKQKIYKTMGGYLRVVKTTMLKVLGTDDYMTLEEGDKGSVEDILLRGDNAVHNEGSRELGYKMGWDLEYPDRLYVFYEEGV